MKVKFTQFFDVASSADNFQVFTIKAGGEIVKQRCLPQFVAFNKYKLGSVSVKMVPASTLPVDPTGLSYETGETTVDPRDMFNPGLVRITNGEPVATIGDMNNYYSTLLDPRWFKFQLQQGFSRYAKPLVYNIGEIAQDSSPFFGDVNDTVNKNTYLGHVNGSVSNGNAVHVYDDSTTIDIDNIFSHAPIQTGKIKLGWLPTNSRGNASEFTQSSSFYGTLSRVPEVDVLTFILPKAFKTKFYYRVFVEETVYFKDPVAINPVVDGAFGYLPIDRFVGMRMVEGNSSGGVDIGTNFGFTNARK